MLTGDDVLVILWQHHRRALETPQILGNGGPETLNEFLAIGGARGPGPQDASPARRQGRSLRAGLCGSVSGRCGPPATWRGGCRHGCLCGDPHPPRRFAEGGGGAPRTTCALSVPHSAAFSSSCWCLCTETAGEARRRAAGGEEPLRPEPWPQGPHLQGALSSRGRLAASSPGGGAVRADG